MTDWHIMHEKVEPYIARIETPSGFGSGFLFAYNKDKTIAAFATAAHVVEYADTWNLPIKLIHHSSGKQHFLNSERRVIFLDRERDSASILCAGFGDDLPDDVLPMLDPSKFKRVGVEVAWSGYPGNAYPNLCLFKGTVSALLEYQDSYLIDGVAINGVSGGPVFADIGNNQPELLGSVSAYMPNRQSGDVLPGMLRAQDVTAFQTTVSTMQSLDEAAEKKKESEKERRLEQESGEEPPDEPPKGLRRS